jgi:hypothetical protein
MRVYTAEDFDALIAALPNAPENQAVYSQLMQMRDENSVERQPYTFEVDFATTITQGTTNVVAAPAAAGGQATNSFLVDTSSPFMLVSTTFRADLAGAAQNSGALVTPNHVVLIQDQSSNRNWMNCPVPVTSLFGSAQLPYFWPQPRLLPGNTNVQIQLTNYDAASVPNVRLSFHGYRLYSTRK